VLQEYLHILPVNFVIEEHKLQYCRGLEQRGILKSADIIDSFCCLWQQVDKLLRCTVWVLLQVSVPRDPIKGTEVIINTQEL
jgi:hypothetical protein